ncbi:AAA family ATPase [Novosphingobium sp. CCH12-A3]|uniref:AAA family ATPase n=1 Tax=Novosphingobium sp. CCH12-A3 TaxID=1768752 RepID=UPI0012E34965
MAEHSADLDRLAVFGDQHGNPHDHDVHDPTAAGDRSTLPWFNAAAFARRALEISINNFQVACGLRLFDRCVVDAAVAIRAASGDCPTSAIDRLRYDKLFLAAHGLRFIYAMTTVATAWRRRTGRKAALGKRPSACRSTGQPSSGSSCATKSRGRDARA